MKAQWLRLGYLAGQGNELLAVAPWLGTVAGSALISGAAGELLPFVSGVILIALGVAPVAAQGTFSRLEKNLEDKVDAREQMIYAEAVQLLQEVADITRTNRMLRLEARAGAIARVMDFLQDQAYADLPGMRAHVYLLSGDGASLKRLDRAGEDKPARDFEANEERTAAALALLAGAQEYLVVPDVSQSTNPDWFDGRSYRSFIAVPIRSAGAAYGLLTLDSSQPNGLSEDDAKLVQVLASTLCVFFAEAARGQRAE